MCDLPHYVRQDAPIFAGMHDITVLIVDDDPLCLEEQAELLTSLGLSCLTAGSADAALAMIDDDIDINIVVIDIYMPAHNGLWLLRQLQQRRDAGRNISALLISGHMSLDCAVSGLRHDACDCLTKPVASHDFAGAIARIAARTRRMTNGQLSRQLSLIHDGVRWIAEQFGSHLSAIAPAALASDFDALKPDIQAGHLRAILAARRERTQHFDGSIFADPAWDILLSLMLARSEGRVESANTLAAATNVPDSTAKRWIRAMTSLGLLVRSDDPLDSRRSLLSLSDETTARMQAYLRAVPDATLAL